jgi:immune inhibitor A
MADEAFEAAISSTDFDPEVYDNDGNGYVCGTGYCLFISMANTCQVDAFVVVHAGRGAEQTGDMLDLWSVKWTLPKEREAEGKTMEIHVVRVTYRLLGVKVYGFMTVPEDASCGVCAHELGHLGEL